jgi:hypothetical protein
VNLYFPLRSNVDYRELQPLELDLESRMKLSALLFDELIFENGVLATLIGRRLKLDLRGYNMDELPAHLQDAYSSDDGVFAVEVDGTPIQDEAVRRYSLSYDRILKESGLYEQPWVRISQFALTPSVEQHVESLSDGLFAQLDDGDDTTRVFRRSVISHVLYDQVLAVTNSWELNLDPLHFTWLAQMASSSELVEEQFPVPIDYEKAFPDLPALDQISWEEILEVREHNTMREVRDTLSGISRELMEAHLTGASGLAVRNQLKAWSYNQLMDEIPELLTGRKERVRSTVVSLALNAFGLFPELGSIVTAASSSRDIVAAIAGEQKSSRSLVAALMKRRNHQERWNR